MATTPFDSVYQRWFNHDTRECTRVTIQDSYIIEINTHEIKDSHTFTYRFEKGVPRGKQEINEDYNPYVSRAINVDNVEDILQLL